MARLIALAIPREMKMNKAEQAYAERLENLRLGGRIYMWKFEAVKLRLADGAMYTPDFFVVNRAMGIEFHEVKGFWREAARVRIKVAAELYPFKFIAVQRTPGGWKREEF